MRLFRKQLSAQTLILGVSFFVVCFLNKSFFSGLIEAYSLKTEVFYISSLTVALVLANVVLLNIFNIFQILKPVLVFFILISTFSAYYMDTYNVIIDQAMISNILKTDRAEVFDLMSWRLLIYLLLFALLPSVVIYKLKVNQGKYLVELRKSLQTILLCLLSILILVAASSKFYASFFREHKELRYRVNPAHGVYSATKFLFSKFKTSQQKFEEIGLDAKISEEDLERDLVILVIGETARSDRFSLNGYSRETNPLLKQENVISFMNMFSCGTSTAHSVPCMFSNVGENHFKHGQIDHMDNVLDVLSHTRDIKVLWRDNNSDSKGVALRVAYEDFKSPRANSICDEECRDEGMLVGLQEYINLAKEKDILIVLHQMGSHGPAYYKRYPKSFEKFQPVCETNELSQCSNEQISNAYDNSILYTDYFLSKVINLLKNNSSKFETAMFYISDHGESLGENGVYLHSLPNFIAPKEQKNVPAIMWFGGEMKNEIDLVALNKSKSKFYTHDYFFNTIIGLFEVETKVYHPELDMLAPFYYHGSAR